MKVGLALVLTGAVLLAGCAPKVVTRSEMRRLYPGMTYAGAVDSSARRDVFADRTKR